MPLQRWLLVLFDAIAVWVAMAGAWWLRMGVWTPPVVPPQAPYARLAIASLVVVPLAFGWAGLYRKRRPLFDEALLVAGGVALTAAMQAGLIFFYRGLGPSPDFTYSRLLLVLGWLGLFFLAVLGRALIREEAPAYVVVGDSPLSRLIEQRARVLAYLAPEAPLDSWLEDPRVRVILADPQIANDRVQAWINQFGAERFLWLPHVLGLVTTHLAVEPIGGLPLVAFHDIPLRRPLNRWLKRCFDLVVGTLILLLLAPLMLLITLLIAPPRLFRQTRLGQGGNPFQILKFRTMVPEAEKGTGPIFASRGDARTTRLGAWLRRSSLDELPQLLNVLKGEMSLVGPRPERPEFVEKFAPLYWKYPHRHLVKPGITGWAQVHGLRGDTPIAERTQHDLFYLENWSLLLDVKILLLSVGAVIDDFRRHRAY